MGWLAFLISVTALHSDGNWKCSIMVCNATQNAGCCEIFCKVYFFFSSFFLHFNRLDRIVLPDRAVSSGRISIVSAITRSGMPPLCIIHPLTPTFSSQYNAIYNQCIMHYTSVNSNFFIAIQCIMYYTSADSNFFIIIQCIMYYTSADSNIFIAIQCTLQSMHYGLYVR